MIRLPISASRRCGKGLVPPSASAHVTAYHPEQYRQSAVKETRRDYSPCLFIGIERFGQCVETSTRTWLAPSSKAILRSPSTMSVSALIEPTLAQSTAGGVAAMNGPMVFAFAVNISTFGVGSLSQPL